MESKQKKKKHSKYKTPTNTYAYTRKPHNITFHVKVHEQITKFCWLKFVENVNFKKIFVLIQLFLKTQAPKVAQNAVPYTSNEKGI